MDVELVMAHLWASNRLYWGELDGKLYATIQLRSGEKFLIEAKHPEFLHGSLVRGLAKGFIEKGIDMDELSPVAYPMPWGVWRT